MTVTWDAESPGPEKPLGRSAGAQATARLVSAPGESHRRGTAASTLPRERCCALSSMRSVNLCQLPSLGAELCTGEGWRAETCLCVFYKELDWGF